MTTRVSAVVLASALALSGVAAAGDRLFVNTDDESILTDFDGRAMWELQAICAGHHRATAAYWQSRGRGDRADAARAQAAATTDDVVAQLRSDRGLTDRNEAVRTAAAVEQVGYRATQKALARDGVSPDGRWNFWRSVCVAAKRAYRAQ